MGFLGAFAAGVLSTLAVMSVGQAAVGPKLLFNRGPRERRGAAAMAPADAPEEGHAFYLMR